MTCRTSHDQKHPRNLTTRRGNLENKLVNPRPRWWPRLSGLQLLERVLNRHPMAHAGHAQLHELVLTQVRQVAAVDMISGELLAVRVEPERAQPPADVADRPRGHRRHFADVAGHLRVEGHRDADVAAVFRRHVRYYGAGLEAGRCRCGSARVVVVVVDAGMRRKGGEKRRRERSIVDSRIGVRRRLGVARRERDRRRWWQQRGDRHLRMLRFARCGGSRILFLLFFSLILLFCFQNLPCIFGVYVNHDIATFSQFFDG